MSVIQHSPGIEWVMFRLGSGGTPMSTWADEGRHSAFPTDWRDPGTYVGKHRVDDARVGSVIVARFHNAPARLVTLTRMEVSA